MSIKIHKENIKFISEFENTNFDTVWNNFLKGKIAYFKNYNRDISPIAVGLGLSTKINANIGTSQDSCNINDELKKIEIAKKFGADTIMDLSTSGDIPDIRKKIMDNTDLPLGTVPIYECYVNCLDNNLDFCDMRIDQMLDIIENHAKSGVDYMTIHIGVTKDIVNDIKKNTRLMAVVSRGGSLIAEWINKNGKENPFLENFDKIIDISKKYNSVISLGDGLRPGCIFDSTDNLQIKELIKLGDLQQKALKAGAQVIIEGPGHMPISDIAMNVKLQKKLCNDAPFYVLGPIPIDTAPGYDHITGAIGGAIAASAGADFLCYVTPAEHIRLPSPKDVKLGTIATKIAAQIGDLEKGIKKVWDNNYKMDKARSKLDWNSQSKYAIDPDIIKHSRKMLLKDDHKDTCSMCGSLCSFKTSDRLLN